jgi:hypothetical protein
MQRTVRPKLAISPRPSGRLIGITSKLRDCPSIPVPTKRSVHSIHESPAGNIPDTSYRSVHDPAINGRSREPQPLSGRRRGPKEVMAGPFTSRRAGATGAPNHRPRGTCDWMKQSRLVRPPVLHMASASTATAAAIRTQPPALAGLTDNDRSSNARQKRLRLGLAQARDRRLLNWSGSATRCSRRRLPTKRKK